MTQMTIPGDPAYVFTDARMLLVDATVSPDAAAALLPPPLELAEPATATFFFARYPSTAFGSVYEEAGLLLHGRDDHGEYLHCCWIVVNDSTALILGREMFGFPKKMAEVSFEMSEDRAVGSVTRRGTEILRIVAELGEEVDRPAPLFGQRCINAVGSPITGMTLLEASTGESIHSEREASAEIHLGSAGLDALGALGPAEVLRARSVGLDYGTVDPPPKVVGQVEDAWVGANYWPRAL